MITHEQVADLQPGDIVEYSGPALLQGAKIVGPLVGDQALTVGGYTVRHGSREPTSLDATLTVVSRAPRPLYVNHPRAEPVPGDVVRDADDDLNETWVYARHDCGAPWYASRGKLSVASRESLPARLRLLVDGDTGQVVP